jgi:hypothetical protein
MWEKTDKFIRDELTKPVVLVNGSYASGLIRYLGEHGTQDDIDLIVEVARNTSVEGYIRGEAIEALMRIRERERDAAQSV